MPAIRFAAATLARPKRAATLARSAEPAHRRFVSSPEGSLLPSDPGSKTFRVVAATRRFRRVALAAISRVACTLGTSRHPQVSAAPEVTSWELRTQTSPHPSPADRGDFTSPADRGDFTSPADRGDFTSPADRGDFTSPADRGDFTSPADRGDFTSPADRGDFTSPADRGDFTSPADRGDFTSPADRGDFGGTEGNSSFGSGRSLWSMRSRRDTCHRSPLNDAVGLPGWGGQSRSFQNCLLFPGESVAHNRRLTAVPTRVLGRLGVGDSNVAAGV